MRLSTSLQTTYERRKRYVCIVENSAIVLQGWPQRRVTSEAAFPQEAVLWKEALIGSFQDIRRKDHSILDIVVESRFFKIIDFIVGI